MGTRIRTSCPACGECELQAHEVTLRLSSLDATASTYAFRCPSCLDPVVKPADANVVRLLSSSGEVRRARFEPPHLLENRPSACATPYTEDELLDDMIALAAMPATEIINRVWEARR